MNKAISYSRFLILCQYPIYCSGPGLALLKRKAVSYVGCDFWVSLICTAALKIQDTKQLLLGLLPATKTSDRLILSGSFRPHPSSLGQKNAELEV